jgi:hypothetical protein
MSSQEKKRKQGRSGEERESSEAAPPAASVFRTRDSAASRPRIWVLPLAGGEAWTVAQEAEPARLAADLCKAPADVLSIRVAKEEQPAAVRFAGESLDAKYGERAQELLFGLVSRLVLCGGWLLVALLGLRIPGEAKFFGDMLLVTGLGYLGYTLVRYALPFKNWKQTRSEAVKAILDGSWKHSTLLDRMAQALKLRKELKVEERGQSPDTELLDANAYRKLIRDGVTTTEEFCALGQAVGNAMGLPGDEDAPEKIADIARRCKIDTDSAIFYRDLAAAAAEIKLDELGALP